MWPCYFSSESLQLFLFAQRTEHKLCLAFKALYDLSPDTDRIWWCYCIVVKSQTLQPGYSTTWALLPGQVIESLYAYFLMCEMGLQLLWGFSELGFVKVYWWLGYNPLHRKCYICLLNRYLSSSFTESISLCTGLLVISEMVPNFPASVPLWPSLLKCSCSHSV